jgi:hypothetical protein
MNWEHRVNPEWLDKRREYLTASDICKLLPTTPTGRPRSGIDEVLLKVWAKKQCQISDDDVRSTGVMARGHILEPYAIDTLNKSGLVTLVMNHWDDCLVYSKDGIACSPDGLDISPLDSSITWVTNIEPMHVVEVKCYSAEQHYLLGMSESPGTLLERWQIATAMYVMPTITLGMLVFYNPSAKHPLFMHSYTRTKLASELAIIKKIGEAYRTAALVFETDALALCDEEMAACTPYESAIIAAILDAEAADGPCLNP